MIVGVNGNLKYLGGIMCVTNYFMCDGLGTFD